MNTAPKKWAAALAALALGAGLLAGCTPAAAEDAAPESGGEGQATSLASPSDKVKAEDLDASWDAASATAITLEGGSARVEGAGATAEGSVVTITAAGTYVASGSLSDGQIIVDAPDAALVRLVLNGAEISCSSSAPITCKQADKLLVILADGTENTLTDGESYSYPDAATDEPDAALFSKVDLTINGTGALTVNARYNNGIGTKDDLILVSGSLTVEAANHAIRGRDSVTALEPSLNLTAGNDGIQSNYNETGDDKGWIELYGGSYTITANNDAIQAETDLTIFDGTYSLTTGGGAANAPQRVETGPGGFGGRGDGTLPENFTPPEGMELPEGMTPPEGMEPPTGGQAPEGRQAQAAPAQTQPTQADDADSQPADAAASGDSSESTESTENTESTEDTENTESTEDTDTASDSCKGLKAGGSLAVSGGSFTIDSADDALHANGDVTVSGGSLSLATGDDGIHADGTTRVEGEPVIDITECYEGIEGSDVIIAGGAINIVADDDGLNAAGGSTDEATDEATGETAAETTDGAATEAAGPFGADKFNKTGDYLIRIEGGTLNITAGTDGMDSNGDIEIAGGAITIQMTNPQAIGGDGIIDRDGALTVTGGTLVGAGGNGVAILGPGGTGGEDSATQPVLDIRYSATQAAGTLVELKDASGSTVASFTAEYDFTAVVLSTPEMQDGESYTLYTGGEETLTLSLSGSLTTLSDTGEAVTNEMGGGFGGRGGNRAMPEGMTPPDQQQAATESAT